MSEHTYIFTSESVSEGHPDKVCDQIADAVLDAALTGDPASRVACEVLCKDHRVILAGEISTRVELDLDKLVRETVREIGYVDPGQPFHADRLEILQFLSAQAEEIAHGVSGGGRDPEEQGAGDQGIMFGFASDETPELMPLPILLAHRLARTLAEHRKGGAVDWLRPDSKTQVSVRYEGNAPVEVTDVLVSTQHAPGVAQETIHAYVTERVVPEALGFWHRSGLHVRVNPSGSFVQGGPSADAGVTGRKIIVDTYGGMGRHGGGAFSGKDPSKVDRSGAYFGRWVARQVVKEGLAAKAEVQVSYAIGEASPISVLVDTFGTGDARQAAAFVKKFDFRPAAIIERLGLLHPIYRRTTNYGHFGRNGFTWEE
jgi:S-adenosylmethionine synthetase